EAEWEYAARGDTTTAYSFGDDAKDLKDYGWYGENSGGKTHPVASLKPNPFGLYDVHGNVTEWVQDWYDRELLGGVNPVGPVASSLRDLRGGSWVSVERRLRSAFRGSDDRGSRYSYAG